MASRDKLELDPADCYEPPSSSVAEAIQFPLDERWVNRVMNAYRKDGATKVERKPDASRAR